MKTRLGALPCQMIQELIQAHAIVGIPNTDNIQPASLDLTISGEEIYEIDSVLLPQNEETVRDLLAFVSPKRISIKTVLEVGKVYLARLNESLDLPSGVYGIANPKSSTGRIDLHVRVITDGLSQFDRLASGYKGSLWAVIIPKSFRTKLARNISLNQMRFFTGDTRFSLLDLELAYRKQNLIWDIERREPVKFEDLCVTGQDGSVLLGIDLSSSCPGWCAKKTDKVLDLSRQDNLLDDFWEKITVHGGMARLEKDRFYILTTHESVMIPPDIACEVVAMDDRSGEYRTHYAGFVDPGFGMSRDGKGYGNRVTLEVRPFDDVTVRHRQRIARFVFEAMCGVPDFLYGDAPSSNYGVQLGAGLSKYFV